MPQEQHVMHETTRPSEGGDETHHDDAIVSAKLQAMRGDLLELAIPGVNYVLHLRSNVPADQLEAKRGRRIRGTVHAQAQRMHPARAGGCYIEPVWGEPRIVTGTVAEVDPARRRVLVQSAVPMWVTAPVHQDFAVIETGRLVNFHIESGASFTPLPSAD